MSYSDYGGYAWKDGVRYTDAEDGTVVGVVAPQERPLEAATGLKFDVLLNAAKQQGQKYGEEDERYDWHTQHPHHVVFGGMHGIALVGHKQSVTILHDGREIRNFPMYDGNNVDEVKNGPEEIQGTQDGFVWVIRQVRYPHSSGCLMYLRTPDGTAFSGCCGYGIGGHWWKDDDGREFLKTGDRPEPYPWGWMWSSVAEKEDCEKLGVKPGTFIGYKQQEPWPTYERWKQRVQEWVSGLTLKEPKE